MKKLIIMAILGVILSSEANAGWFNSKNEKEPATSNPEHELRIEAINRAKLLEQQLTEQRSRTESWQIATGAISVGSVILFAFGAALGVKVRRDEKAP